MAVSRAWHPTNNTQGHPSGHRLLCAVHRLSPVGPGQCRKQAVAQGTIQSESSREGGGGGAGRAGGQFSLSQAFFSASAPPSRARAHCCQSPEVSFFFLPKAVSCLSFELGCQLPHTVTLLQQPPRLLQQGRALGTPLPGITPPLLCSLLSALVWVLSGLSPSLLDFPPTAKPSRRAHPVPHRR